MIKVSICNKNSNLWQISQVILIVIRRAYCTDTEQVLLYMDKEKDKTELIALYAVHNKKGLRVPNFRIYQIIFNVFQMLQLVFPKT